MWNRCFASGTGERVIRGVLSLDGITIHVRQRLRPEEECGKPLAFREAGDYTWNLETPLEACRVRVRYFGDQIFIYHKGRLISDQYYYGDFHEFYKPEGIEKLEIRIAPLLPEREVYLECIRRDGAGLEEISCHSVK